MTLNLVRQLRSGVTASSAINAYRLLDLLAFVLLGIVLDVKIIDEAFS